MAHKEDVDIRILTGVYDHLSLPQDKICELDLGCGTGSFSVALAKSYPERFVMCADVMLGRLRKVVRRRNHQEVTNLEVLRVEARHLLGIMLPDASLDRIHLLCPDPWPKNRHRGHRLLCCDFTTQLHRVLKKGAVFHFSSDDEYYCDAVNRVMAQSGLFAACQEAIADLACVQSDFEKRWLAEGKMVHHRAWKKLPLPECTIGH